MNKVMQKYFKNIGIIAAVVCVLVIPKTIQAASAGPVCVMLLKTPSGSVIDMGKTDVLLQKGDALDIYWFSANAKKAENKNGNIVPLFGHTTKTPKTKTTYTYTFSDGKKNVDCSVTVYPAEGDIASRSLLSVAGTPTITGTALDVDEVSLRVFKAGVKKALYESGDINVFKGKWEHKIKQSLGRGEYTVALYGSESLKLNMLSQETLTIGTVEKGESMSTIVVQAVPLLVGGTAKKGQEIGLSYLQILNVGLQSANITGIRVKQIGTASTDVIAGLSAIDDTELSKGRVSNLDGDLFIANEAVIPLSLVLKSKETRLVTLKADIGSVLSKNGGTLRMVISGVESATQVKAEFPIRGVTWTVAE